ncbi:MAG: spermidine/putrescine ABC transporter substrate-binding protein [Candidatus Lutibacillus vidarii]|jgi:spermidine/putrescine-binding protein|nr:spermidine/putrescine ABC transporter substrate-binding protein [Dermatophilaceae bacterium]
MSAISRRQLLSGAAVLGLSTVLPACSTTSESRVSFLNWQDYIDPTLLTDFTAKSGLTVGYETYASNDALFERLIAAGVTRKGGRKTTTFDLIVPSENLFRRLRNADALQTLDSTVVTEALLGSLLPEMRSLPADPGNRYSVPWAIGMTGIGYDTSVFPEPPAWDVFLDAAHAGKMSLLDERREAFAAALFSLGQSPNATDAATITAAKDQLGKMKANVSFNSETYLDDLASGKLVAAQAFNTDVLQARRKNPKLAFVVPKAGGTRWVDLLCIPADAPNSAGANKLIAFYLDPKVSAANATYNLVATGNLAARAFVPKEVLDDPAVYPSDEVAKTLVFLEDLGESEALYDTAWEALKKA